MQRLTISIPGQQPYDISIAPGLLQQAGSLLRAISPSAKAAIVTDAHVQPLHLPALRASLLAAGFEPIITTIQPGEDHKSIASMMGVYDALLGARIERTTPVLALGGGLVGDLAGFAAATILRGVPFVQIPTTLLAMVDASVGGKTGVNHAAGKNLIGAFHQPIAVLIDPQTLTTLPARELRSGLAECIKHDLIRDADGFAQLEQHIDRALRLDIDYLAQLVGHNVAIKARVVESDPFEHADRAHLNLGHTFGHAIETVSHYDYAHGECVALGMVAAAHLSVRLNLMDAAALGRIKALIQKAGLPAGGMSLSTADIMAAMMFDKKVKGGRLRFILPDRIGHVIIRDDVPLELAADAIDQLRG